MTAHRILTISHYFADEKDMEDSKNQGFAVLDKDQVKCKVRFFRRDLCLDKGRRDKDPGRTCRD